MGNTSRKCCQHINIQIRELSMGRVRNTRNTAQKYGQKGEKNKNKNKNVWKIKQAINSKREKNSVSNQNVERFARTTIAIQDTNGMTIDFVLNKRAHRLLNYLFHMKCATWFPCIKWNFCIECGNVERGHSNNLNEKIIIANSSNIRIKITQTNQI